MTEHQIILAAKKWHDVRKEIFAKEYTDIKDWENLAEVENDLMKAVSGCQ